MSRLTRRIVVGFARGMSKTLDIGNTYRPYRIEVKHGENIKRSWQNVGIAMKKSMEAMNHESARS